MDQPPNKQDEHNAGCRTELCPDEWKCIMQFLTTRQVMRTCARVSKTLYRIVCEELDLDIECNTFGSWQSFMSADGQCKTRTKTMRLNAAKHSYSDLMRSISSENRPIRDIVSSSLFEEFSNLELLFIENAGDPTALIRETAETEEGEDMRIKHDHTEKIMCRSFVRRLSEFKKVTQLELVQCSLCDDSVDALSDMIHLIRLDLSINHISGERIDGLCSLTELTHLNLSENRLNGIRVFGTLSRLTKLAHLDLSYNRIDGSDVKHSDGFGELTNLDLSHNKIQDTAGLIGFKKLSSLSLRNNSIDDIHPLCGLPLTYLDVGRNRVRGSASVLKFPFLTTLCISDNELTDAHTAFIESIFSLGSLDISSNLIGTEGAEGILSMPNLDWVNLSLNNIDFDTLPQVSKFTCLYIQEQKQDRPLSIKSIEGCDSLREFSACYWNIGDEGARIMSVLLQLTKVEVRSCGLTKEGAIYLSNLKHLVKLDISLNAITDDGVDYLCSMKKLKSLNLSKCSITNQSLVHVSRLPCLRMLDLSRNLIDDYGIVYLKDMPTLAKLYLSHTRVSDSALSSLEGVSDMKRLCGEYRVPDMMRRPEPDTGRCIIL